MPDPYVQRPELLAQVEQALLDSGGSKLLPGQGSKRIALHGMGGIGKTVLARAICGLPEVQAAFPHGILWASIGQQPDLVSTLRGWVHVLGGTVPEVAPTVDSLKATLANLLKYRTCLLVTDDISSSQQIELFQIDSPRSCVLLTLRDSELAEKVNAHIVRVPTMVAAESTALLSRSAAGTLNDNRLAVQIAERLGHLPLAIKLAGSQLRRCPADQWLRSFDVTKLRSRRPGNLHDSLELTFGLSLDALHVDNRARYVALAIFRAGEPIPTHAVIRLWRSIGGLQSQDDDDLLNDLQAHALVDFTTVHGQPAVSLHNLLHDLIAAKLGEEGRRTLHQNLLDTYRTIHQEQGWHTLRDEGYLRTHLAWHLEQAGLHNELHALFREQTPDGRNAWFEARDPLGETGRTTTDTILVSSDTPHENATDT